MENSLTYATIHGQTKMAQGAGMGIGISLKFDQNTHDQVSFLAPGPSIGFDVTPNEALDYFKAKGLRETFSWQEMLADEHDKAFTVAKMMDLDILSEVRARVDEAISQGKSRQWFKDELEPILQKAGWWGRKPVTDPATGKEVVAQLGSVRRLELIYRTNLQASYSIGHWAQSQATKAEAPWLMYDAVDDTRTRPEHARLDGKILPVDSPFWKTHYPPNGWNCRCGTIQLSDSELQEFGLKPSREPRPRLRIWKNPKTGKIRKVPRDLDPGWDYNPGISWHEKAQSTLAEKIGALAPDMAKSAMEGLAAQQKAKSAYRSQLAVQAAQKTLAKEQGIIEQAKSVARAQEHAARAQLDAIEAAKTKYKYAALKQIKKTKAGASMSAKNLLSAVEAKAEKAKTSAALAHYKQAAINGAKPSQAATKAFNSLPEEAQKSMLADIEAKSAIVQQQKAAAATLKDIQDNPAGQKLKQKSLIEELKGESLAGVSDPVALLAKVESKAAAAQAKASQSAALSGYKGKVLEGKIPTASQKKAFDALAPDEKKAFLKKVDSAKAELDEFKTLYEGAYASAPSSNEVKGFIKSKAQTKIETLKFLKKKQPPPAIPETPKSAAPKSAAPKAQASNWAPTMTSADAKKWAKDSVIKTPASHFTSAGASKLIKAGGFDLKHAGTAGGDVFGNSIYLVPDPKGAGKASANFYKKFVGSSEVQAYVNVQKVKTIHADNIYLGKIYYQGKPVTANIADPHVTGMQQAMLSGIKDADKKYAAALKTTESSENFYMGNKGEAVQKVLKDEGYDAIRIVNKQFDEGVGGEQLIVFDPENIVVVNPKAKKITTPKAASKSAPKAKEQGLDAAKATIVNPVVEAEDWSTKHLSQTGRQKGSNAGGFFQDQETGEKWYIKTPASEDMARNEVLAGKLYRAAGVDVPDLHLVDTGGGVSIASRVIDGISQDLDAMSRGALAGQNDAFAVDAWLANWDVAGLNYDNLLVNGKRAIRIDVGGSLRYRAQGGPKGSAFGETVDEIKTLRDPATNPQSAFVFEKVKKADIEAGVARIAGISDEEIGRIVDQWGPRDAAEKAALKETLIARKQDLVKRYPGAIEAKPIPASAMKREITHAEAEAIKESRANGMAIRSDIDDIEDQQVVFSEYTGSDNKVYTRAYLKIRPEAGARVQKTKLRAGSAPLGELDGEEAAKSIERLVIGVNAQLDAGAKALRPRDVTRIAEAKKKIASAKKDISDFLKVATGDNKKITGRLKNELDKWSDLIEKLEYENDNGRKITRFPKYNIEKILVRIKESSKEAKLTKWEEAGKMEYQKFVIERGHPTVSGGPTYLETTERTLISRRDGLTAKYVPYNKGNSFSTEGMMLIDIEGGSDVAAKKVFDLIEEAGINPDRPTMSMQREMYLDKLMYIRTTGADKAAKWERYEELKNIQDESERLRLKLAMVNDEAKMDITTSKGWKNPDGEHQAFGHGRKTLERPDLDGPEFDRFADDYHLYHNPASYGSSGTTGRGTWEALSRVVNGGGQFAPIVDRVRRGIPVGGTSASSDLNSGGGQYFFTRIKERSNARITGVFFEPKIIKRMDAVTYDGDMFGEVKPELIRSAARKTTVSGFRSAAKNRSNETIFKDSVSIFDGVEKIVLWDQEERMKAISDMKSWGYERWPDGRALEDVIDAVVN